MKKKDENSTRILPHLLGIFTGWIGPLVLLLVIKSQETKQHSRKALNWQISYSIYSILIILLVIFFLFSQKILLFVFFILTFISLCLLDIIFCIIASVKANKGELWDYPLSIRFLR